MNWKFWEKKQEEIGPDGTVIKYPGPSESMSRLAGS